jgi:hypothetical protein
VAGERPRREAASASGIQVALNLGNLATRPLSGSASGEPTIWNSSTIPSHLSLTRLRD